MLAGLPPPTPLAIGLHPALPPHEHSEQAAHPELVRIIHAGQSDAAALGQRGERQRPALWQAPAYRLLRRGTRTQLQREGSCRI